MRNILFLCTGNSARSIMAEAYMNQAGGEDWSAFSAGSNPTKKINPFAIETLQANDVTIAQNNARSKSWDEFSAPDAPVMDVVVTVCDNAAAETCPVWPLHNGGRNGGAAPVKIHWSFPDPAAAKGSDKDIRQAFELVFADIRDHIDAFLSNNQHAAS